MYKKIKERVQRKIYTHKAGNMAAEQFKLEELVKVIDWLNEHMKYRWIYIEEATANLYWRDVAPGTQTLTNDCFRFYFMRKKDAALFRLTWG